MYKKFIQNVSIVLVFAAYFQAFAQVDSNFHVYLLFGQSNMAGGCNHATVDPASIDRKDTDCDTTPRVKVLAWGDCDVNSAPCPDLKVKRTYDQWYTAFPPYHKCTEGIGPADYFGKTLLDSIREDISIGFIPCALSGQNIAVFEKGSSAAIDEHTQPYRGGQRLPSGAYEWMVKRCQIAQKTGVIKGILFHQGEANKDEASWPGRVAKIVENLRNDLNLGEEVPFLAGEVLRTGDAASHNTTIAKVPSQVPNSYVISAEGLTMRTGDTWRLHFSCASVREFGKRYAEAFLKAVDNDFVPRKGTTPTIHKPIKKTIAPTGLKSFGKDITVYSLNGSTLGKAEISTKGVLKMKSPGVYLLKTSLTDGTNTIMPFIQN